MAKVTQEVEFNVDTQALEEASKGVTSNYDALVKSLQEAVAEMKNLQSAMKGVADESKKVSSSDTMFDNVSGFSKIKSEMQALLTYKKQFNEQFSGDGDMWDTDSIVAYKMQAERVLSQINAFRQQSGNSDAFGSIYSSVSSELSNLEGTASQVGNRIKSTAISNAKSVGSVISSTIGSAFKSTLTDCQSVLKKIMSAFKSMLSSIGQGIRTKFSSLFNFQGAAKSCDNLTASLKSLTAQLVSIYAIVNGIKSAIESASSIVESANVIDGAFGDSAEEVNEWAETCVSAFGLTELEAKKMVGIFGSMLKGMDVDNDAAIKMSENLTALAGDMASYLNMDVDTAYTKIKSALSGETEAIKDTGIVMTVDNLKNYASTLGVVYDNLDQTGKAAVRYNYLMSQAGKMGMLNDFADTTASWANQVRLLKNNLAQLGAYIGGAFIKLLYPVVTVLNQIVQALLNVFSVMASIFGFDTASLSDMFGSGASVDDSTISGLEDEADAIDDVGDAAKNASDNLQGFDKLNNMTTSSSSSSSSSGSGAGGSGIDFDLLSYDWSKANAELPQWVQDLTEIMQELKDCLSQGDWVGAGKAIAKAINYISTALNNFLKDPNISKKIDSVTTAIAGIFEGLLDVDTNLIGQNLGLTIDYLADFVNELYEKVAEFDGFGQVGKKIEEFFEGILDTVNFESVGKAWATKNRILVDIIYGWVQSALDNDAGTKVGGAIRDFLVGATERLYGNGGAEKIGKSIAGVINLACDAVISFVGDGTAIESLANYVVTSINTAIQGIDENKLSNAIQAIIKVFATIFKAVGNIDVDTLSDKISGAINGTVKSGALSDLASSLVSALGNLAKLLIETVKKIDWGGVAQGILDAIGEGFKNGDMAYILAAIALIFTKNLVWSGISALISGTAFSTIANGVLTQIGSNIAGAGASTGASTITSGVSAVLSSSLGGVLVDALFIAACAAIAGAIITDIATEVKKNTEYKSLWRSILADDTLELNLDIDTTASKNLLDLTVKLGFLKTQYDNINGSAADFKKYLEALKKAGFENTTQYQALATALEGVNSDGTMTASVASQVETAAADCTSKVLELIQGISNLSEEEATNVDESTTWSTDVSSNITSGQSNIETAIKDTVDGATTLTEEQVKASGRRTGLTWGTGSKAGISSKESEIQSSIQTAVGNATTNSLETVKSKGNSSGATWGSGAGEGVSGKTSDIQGKMSSTISTATSNTKETASSKGSTLGNALGTGIGTGVSGKESSIATKLSTTVTNSSSTAKTTASTEGTSIGKNITSGINSGIGDQTIISKISGTISSLSSKVLNWFKDALDIHSPSKLMKNQVGYYISAGVAEGIDDGASEVGDSVKSLNKQITSDMELDTSNTNWIDTNELLAQINEARSILSDFTSSLSEVQSMQTQLTLQPAFNNGQLSSALSEVNSTVGITGGLSNIANKLNRQSSNGNLTVQVYLDQNNKLGEYIIDTVNGQTIRGGNF